MEKQNIIDEIQNTKTTLRTAYASLSGLINILENPNKNTVELKHRANIVTISAFNTSNFRGEANKIHSFLKSYICKGIYDELNNLFVNKTLEDYKNLKSIKK